MQSKNLLRPLVVTFLVLLIPLLGNQFVSGWDWSLSDFVIMGILVLVTGVFVELANMRIKNKNYKVAAIGGIVIILLLVWAHLAVGIVDTWPLAGS